MPLVPPLKPLINAAYQAYQDIRKPKEDSIVYQVATSLASAVYYSQYTADNKKSIFKELADLKLELKIEEQNAALRMKLDDIQVIETDGIYYNQLLKILKTCGLFSAQPDAYYITSIMLQVSRSLSVFYPVLDPNHLFFQELKIFSEGMETYLNESQTEKIQNQLTSQIQTELVQAKRTIQAQAEELERLRAEQLSNIGAVAQAAATTSTQAATVTEFQRRPSMPFLGRRAASWPGSLTAERSTPQRSILQNKGFKGS